MTIIKEKRIGIFIEVSNKRLIALAQREQVLYKRWERSYLRKARKFYKLFSNKDG